MIPPLHWAVYMPPSDSPYHSPEFFTLIHNHCMEDYHNWHKSVIIGDINAHICDLTQFNYQFNHMHYAQNVDIRWNTNGESLRVNVGQFRVKDFISWLYNTLMLYAWEKVGHFVVTSYVRQPNRSEYVSWAAKVRGWDDNYWLSTDPIQSYSKILATHHRGVIILGYCTMGYRSADPHNAGICHMLPWAFCC